MNFYEWIQNQRNREDQIGRFARYVNSDIAFPEFETSSVRIKYYLVMNRLDEEAIADFEASWAEYQKSKIEVLKHT